MNARPKIMFVIDSLGAGGAERSLVELLPNLFDLGATPLVVTLKPASDGFEADARATGARILQIDERSRFARVRALRRLIRTEAPCLVHTTLFDSDILGRLACIRLDTAVSTSLVNTSYDPGRYDDPNIDRWKLELARRIDGWTARHFCDRFHAITETVKNAAVDALEIDRDNIVVIGRGRDASRLGRPSAGAARSVARRRLGLARGQLVLLNVGRHEFQKGQRKLVEAVRLLLVDHHDAVLLIAGRDGNCSEELRATIVANHLSDSVMLLGHRQDVGDLLAAADVFVFPSVYEGLGGALIEAMMMEVPVVATDIPTFREVLGSDYPLLCSLDSQSIAEAVGRLVANEGLSRRVVERNLSRVNAALDMDPSRSLARQLVAWAESGRSPRHRE